MTIALTDEFNDPNGEFNNYDSYQQSDRDAVRNLKHRNIRSFRSADTTEAATVLSLANLTMTNLGGRTMTSLGSSTVETGEHWTGDTLINLVPNGSFQHDTIGGDAMGWDHDPQVSVAAASWTTSDPPFTGSNALNTTNAATSWSIKQTVPSPVTPNISYTARVSYFQISSSSNGWDLYIRWLDVNGGVISSVNTHVGNVGNGSNGVTSVTGVAPAGAVTAYVQISHLTDISNMYFDAFMLAPTSQGTTYADGDVSGWTWAGTVGNSISSKSLVTAASDPTLDNFPVLSISCPAAGTYVADSTAAAIDLLNNFSNSDFISVALPSFPASSLNLATTMLTLGDGTNTASVPFNTSLVTLTTGNSELRLLRSQFAIINLAAVTLVRFTIVATAACTVKAMALRLLATTWTAPGVDINTRRQVLNRTPPLNGDTTASPAFAQPILWRAAEPAGPDDPRPIDTEMGIVFNVGTRALTNTFSLYFRELTEDFLTQLDLNGEQMASLDGLDQPDIGDARYNPRVQTDLEPFNQDQLAGEVQTTLERTADYLSASWIVVTCQWTPTSTLISVLDTEGNGYTFPSIPAFTANNNYVLFASIQENCARVTIYNVTQSGIVGSLFFDTTAIIDDTTFKRRRGRFGWYANLRDGDAWIDSIRSRAISYGEYRSLPFESNTPVDGAEIFVSTSPDVEHFSSLLGGPYNSSPTLARDSSRTTTGSSYRVDNTAGLPMQGVQSNIFTVSDFENTEITFDIFYPSTAILAGGSLQAFLLDPAGIYSINLPLPQIFPDQWQHVRMRMPFGQTVLTGSYRFVLVQGTATPSSWWVDNVSIPSRSIAWDGRAIVDDPWNSNDARWTPFRNVINREGGGVLFPHRGTTLQVRGRALLQDATINRVQFKPKYSGLGRFKPNAIVPSTAPTGNFTATTIGTRTIQFASTATDDGYVALSEWNFGDGATGVGSPITHVYAAAGVYTVTLISMDNNGNRSFYSNTVSV